MNTCCTIEHIRNLMDDATDPHSVVAKHVFQIIENIEEHGMSQHKLECLHLVVVPLCENTGFPLSKRLIEGEADCEICAAIKSRITFLD